MDDIELIKDTLEYHALDLRIQIEKLKYELMKSLRIPKRILYSQENKAKLAEVNLRKYIDSFKEQIWTG
jgi:hypothetical protein